MRPLMTFQGHAIEGELMKPFADSPRPLGGEEQPGRTGGSAAAKSLESSRPAGRCVSRAPGRPTWQRLPRPRRNLQAMMIGATPTYYVPGAFDGGVQGIVLSLELPGRTDRIDCSQVNVLGGMPLQSSLFELTKAAAGLLQQRGVRATEVSAATVGLTVLRDAAMHGSPDAPQLQGLDPRQRAVFVAQQNRWRWPGIRRRGPKNFCARRSIACGCRSAHGDRCSAWRPFPRSIGLR